MSQIIVTDLDFCQGEASNHSTLKGGGDFIAWDADFDGEQLFDPTGEAAAGYGVALAVGIGNNPVVVIGVSSIGGQA